MKPIIAESNQPFEYMLRYCEMGYFIEVLQELQTTYDLSDYLFYIDFRWSLDKSPVKLPETDKKVILFMIIDETGYIPLEAPQQAFAIFKMMAKPENLVHKNVFHLPQGPNPQVNSRPIKPIADRKVSIFFSGNLHTGRERLYKYFSGAHILPFPILHRVASLLGRNFDRKFPDGFIRFTKSFRTGLTPAEYSAKLNDSKIVLCPPGNPNPETLRHFEAMRAGCVVISEKSLPPTFAYKDAPMILVDKWKELDTIVPELLNNPTQLEKLHVDSYTWWETHLSIKATASYIYESIKGLESASVR